jgi:hypothetical protein
MLTLLDSSTLSKIGSGARLTIDFDYAGSASANYAGRASSTIANAGRSSASGRYHLQQQSTSLDLRLHYLRTLEPLRPWTLGHCRFWISTTEPHTRRASTDYGSASTSYPYHQKHQSAPLDPRLHCPWTCEPSRPWT